MADWFRYIAFDLWSELGDPAGEGKLPLDLDCYENYSVMQSTS